MLRARHLLTSELLAMAKNTHCLQVLRARHLLTSVLLAMAPKVWMHKPDIPGLLVVRIVEKHSLSTGQIGPRQKKAQLPIARISGLLVAVWVPAQQILHRNIVWGPRAGIICMPFFIE